MKSNRSIFMNAIFCSFVFIFAGFSLADREECFEPSQSGNAVTICVQPAASVVVLYTTFTVDVSILDVVEDGLFGYEFRLNYNSNLLKGIDIVFPEDHFLKPQDPTKLFIVERNFNQAEGCLYVAVTLLAPEESKFGNGTLVTVIFQSRDVGNSELGFSDCNLIGPYAHLSFLNVTLSGGVVYVILPDFNGDMDVDASDLLIVCQAFGSHVGDERWKIPCDVNKDLIINIIDVAVTAKAYGRSSTKIDRLLARAKYG